MIGQYHNVHSELHGHGFQNFHFGKHAPFNQDIQKAAVMLAGHRSCFLKLLNLEKTDVLENP